MSQQAKTEPSHGEYSRCGPWYPLRKRWQSSRLFNQDVGLPPFLEPGDAWWMNKDWFQRSLASLAWPGYIPAPLYVPYISGSKHQTSQKISKEPCKWRVILDMAHFSPSEISLSVKDGFLVVGGKHEERQDEHGFIARSFTRKYRLPGEIDATKITSTLSVDGILTMEAPVPEASVPAAIIIPIEMEMEATEEQQENREEEDRDTSVGPEATDDVCEVDHEVKSPLEVHSDQASDSATADLQQHEEKREQEEEISEKLVGEPHSGQAHSDSATGDLQQHEEKREQEEEISEKLVGEPHSDQAHSDSATGDLQQHEERREQEEEISEKLVGEPHPSASADILQDSSKQHEAMENQENPETDMSKQPEHEEPSTNGEIKEMDPGTGSAEAAKIITTSEELELGKSPPSDVISQELEAPDIKQEHTE